MTSPANWWRCEWQLTIALALAKYAIRVIAVGISGAIAINSEHTLAQSKIIPDSTLGAERSIVIPNSAGFPTEVITGGAIRGANLFHSFQEFNVSVGRGAYFFSPSPDIQNILARVTGINRSEILGTLGTYGNSVPNLFLINPNGIIFGSDARLDIGGSFFASTASSFKFPDGSEFSATNPQAPPLLRINITPGLQWGASKLGATLANTGNLAVGQDLTLVADKLDLQGQLRAGRDLTLLAQDTVRVRDSVVKPFLAQSGGNLTIQGDRGIDILALNHPTHTPFVSKGNLSLISDGIISGDARFATGGSFFIGSISGGLANFVSFYDPIISATGNVDIAANYIGTSLLVEALGNIRFQGSINITGPDTSSLPPGPDTAILSTSSALILRSGQSVLAYGGVNSGTVPAYATRPVPAGITLGGDVTLQPFNGAGGVVSLSAALGNVSTGAIITNGGAITINSARSITTNGRTLDTTNGENNGGAIFLNAANGNISTGDLNSRSFSFSFFGGRAGNGGAITLSATNGNIFTGNLFSRSYSLDGPVGSGGAITLSTINGNISTTYVDSSSFSLSSQVGEGGAITLNAINGSIKTSSLSSNTTGENGGAITLSATNGNISVLGDLRSYVNHVSSSSQGTGGAISLFTNNGNITVAGELRSTWQSDSFSTGGNGGAINVVANNGNIDTGELLSFSVARFDSQVGNGGNINLIANGGSITSGFVASFSYSDSGIGGKGGDISVFATKTIRLLSDPPEGEGPIPSSINSTGKLGSGNITLVSYAPLALDNSVISSDTFGSGKGGDILISAPSIFLTNSAQISASTHSSGQGGTITLRASDTVELGGATTNHPIGFFAPSGLAGFSPNTYLGGFIPTGNTQQLPAKGTLFPSGVFTQTTVGSTGSAGNLRIETGLLSIKDQAAIATSTFGQGNAGNISVKADSISVTNGSILSGVAGGAIGNSGKIDLQTRFLSVTAGGLVQTQTLGQGNAGTIEVNATDAVSLSGDGSALRSASGGTNTLLGTTGSTIGQGGDISITTGNLSVADRAILDAQTQTHSKGGNITVNANTLSAVNGGKLLTSTSSGGRAGDITVNASELNLTGSSSGLFAQTTSTGQAGNLTLQPLSNGQTLMINFQDGAQISASTSGVGKGGTLRVNAPEAIVISGNGILSATADASSNGQAGDVFLSTQQLTVANGARVSASTNSTNPSAFGGNLTVQASQLNLMGGSSLLAGTTGAARGGNLTIQPLDKGQALSINFQDGSTVSASTSGSGRGGTLTIAAPESITLSGNGFVSAGTTGTGTGGNLAFKTGQLTLRDAVQATVSSSEGAGNAGNLEVTANSVFLDNEAKLIAETTSGDGGNITLRVQDLLLMRRTSLISTSAGTAEAGGDGGNITINAPFVVAVPSENSDIRANAFTGRGGRVDITAQSIFGLQFRQEDTPLSDITASSQFGIQGTVTINTLATDPSRGLTNLPTEVVDASDQIAQNCPVAGENVAQNEFIITGRGGVPENPNQMLNNDAVWTDLRPTPRQAATRSSSPVATQPRNSKAVPLVEAQGWTIDEKGQVVLTASAPMMTWQQFKACRQDGFAPGIKSNA